MIASQPGMKRRNHRTAGCNMAAIAVAMASHHNTVPAASTTSMTMRLAATMSTARTIDQVLTRSCTGAVDGASAGAPAEVVVPVGASIGRYANGRAPRRT